MHREFVPVGNNSEVTYEGHVYRVSVNQEVALFRTGAAMISFERVRFNELLRDSRIVINPEDERKAVV